MTKYGKENWQRFQKTGVELADLKAMKLEKVENAFEETKQDFDNLISKLLEGIKNKRWSAIIGDDVSGRLPALVVGKIISEYSKANNDISPHRLFISGGSISYDHLSDEELPDVETVKKNEEEKQQKLEDFIHDQTSKLGDRVLIVTEHIVLGRTIKKIGECLAKEGIKFDVASLWATKNVEEVKILLEDKNHEIFNGVNFYIGKERAGASDPFGSEVIGLMYDLGSPLKESAGIEKDNTEPFTKINKQADRELINFARQKVDEISKELYTKYFN